MFEKLGKLRELRLAGAARRGAFTLKAGEPVKHMHRVVGAALLAVVDDVDAALKLFLYHVRNRFAYGRGELGPRVPGCVCLASKSSTTLAVRGKLPVCVVRIRSVLRFMNDPAQGCWERRKDCREITG